MEHLEQLQSKYSRLKEHAYNAYKQAEPEKQEEIVKLLIATAFEKQQHKEYTRMCDELFNK